MATKRFTDRRLEREVDKAGMVHIRKHLGEHMEVPEYGFAGKGPKNYRRSDERIKEDVSVALFLDHDVDARDIEVEVKAACVFLSGKVYDRKMKRAAEDCADTVYGVVDVQNELTFERSRNIEVPLS